MTEAELNAIAARAEATTPGPWFFNAYSEVVTVNPEAKERWREFLSDWHAMNEPSLRDVDGKVGPWGEAHYAARRDVCHIPSHHGDTATGRHHADGEFIANARTDILLLVEEVRRLRPRTLEEAIAECRKWRMSDEELEKLLK